MMFVLTACGREAAATASDLVNVPRHPSHSVAHSRWTLAVHKGIYLCGVFFGIGRNMHSDCILTRYGRLCASRALTLANQLAGGLVNELAAREAPPRLAMACDRFQCYMFVHSGLQLAHPILANPPHE